MTASRTATAHLRRHTERHRTAHIGWLRAAVLGANDGIVSTASLIVGVAAAGATQGSILTTGIAGIRELGALGHLLLTGDRRFRTVIGTLQQRIALKLLFNERGEVEIGQL